ncbi:MAG TPA: hypothetical protein EYG82_03565 [Sulfurovum sp.]|nr:hypothetical protein [Sulfurovum sp.]
MRYTQKQIDKYNRQRYITELDKIAKNLFRMLRDENVSSQKFMLKFEQLKKNFDKKDEIHLDTGYYQELKSYILRLFEQTCLTEGFDDKHFDDIRDAEMSNLNRLQKLKNSVTYKKDKHKAKRQNEDWG